jgi:hypothetical protein
MIVMIMHAERAAGALPWRRQRLKVVAILLPGV